MMGDFRRELCDSCTIDGECGCQGSEKDCKGCGMDSVISKHKNSIKRKGNRELRETSFFINRRRRAEFFQ
jgi:hypothetical protein